MAVLLPVRALTCAVLAALGLTASPARALTVDATGCGRSLVGEEHAFAAATTDAMGTVSYQWQLGLSAPYVPGSAEMSHTFATPGHYYVEARAIDDAGLEVSGFCWHLVHFPLTERRPTASSPIVYDAARNRIYAVNQDSESITSIDAEQLVKLAELSVYRRPEALAIASDGKLWVLHKDDYAIAVVDLESFTIASGFRLPYASQPVGLAMSPTGDAAYVTLMAVGKLQKLDPTTTQVLGEVDVGPRPRGVTVSHDGAQVFVSRFISPNTGGEVVQVDAATMQVSKRILLPLDTTTVESGTAGRGLPNYLFSVALSPDGLQAWVSGKKDNIIRGQLHNEPALSFEQTVRPLVAAIDVAAGVELETLRTDLDDRSLPVHVEFSPYGDFAVLTLAGSNTIEVRRVTSPGDAFTTIAQAGRFPRATVIGPNNRLFVQGWLSRNVLVYDLTAQLERFDSASPALLADIATVATETLPEDVLAGKRIFHDSTDDRMSKDKYISCGVCHFEGIDDGRVYDFSHRGEGLRNTMALLGRAGTKHGPLNWSGNFDEIQDFEHQLRDSFDGKGFLPDDVLQIGTRSQPLGEPKAGLSPELDALAAYVSSLEKVNPSPYRNPDGSLTADGVAGKAVFEKLGCDFCHGGPDFTDSARGRLHDVGTLTATSGSRAGQPLLGIDSPTLLGAWETPPYLHDGSAPTLRDVLTTSNPTDLHGYVTSIAPEQLEQLIAYVSQLDGEQRLRSLPFEPPQPEPIGGSGGQAGAGAQAGAGGQSASGGLQGTAAGGGNDPRQSSCACRTPGADRRAHPWSAMTALGLMALLAFRRRRACGASMARLAAASRLFLLGILLLGCSAPASNEAPRDPWAQLPAVKHPDPELVTLDTRHDTYERLCKRGRGDAIASALCSSGRRPEIGGMTELLTLVGLQQDRAFALTGNSTSLVARSVSALNPRLIVFPRVGADLQPPATLTAVGFVRGERFVELVSRDDTTGDLNFYLLHFEQACDYASTGCDLASALTEEIEHNWTAYSIYDQDDLEDTSFDCLACHRPGGVGTPRILRMQELSSPWLHWFPQRFVQQTESDRVLGAQFAATHQYDQQYGGIAVQLLTTALDEGSGAQLEALIRAEGFANQPNPFDGHIAKEATLGASATWQSRFDSHLRGEAIAVPYPTIDVTDAVKRDAAVRSYQDVVRGLSARESLLDLREVFSSDAAEKLSFVPHPGADGKTVLRQMCARCHDGRSDPSLSKSRFNVLQLEQLPREVKDRAIVRITETGPRRMPPWRSGELPPGSLQSALMELAK